MKNDAQNHNKTKDNKYVEAKGKQLLAKMHQYMRVEEEAYFEQYFKDFIRQIINDQKVRVSKKRIIEIENLLIDVANGNTGVILASARIQGWLMEAGVEMENK